MRGPARWSRSSLDQLTAVQALPTGVACWRWTERLAALMPEPVSVSVQVTLTEVLAWVVLPSGAVIVTVGAVVSTRHRARGRREAPLPALSARVTGQR